MKTERLYYDDAYLTRFEADVTGRGRDPCQVYLNCTAFYPASGGQPADHGTIGGISVVDVVEDGDRIRHVTARPVKAAHVECEIDWARRFDHMQQHSGQHVLSAVLMELFGLETLSFHLGSEISTIDLDTALLSPEQIRRAEERANQVIFENRPVSVVYEEASQARGLRKPSGRQGLLRIVVVEGLDRTGCGGTHVRATGEIGPLLIRKVDKIRGRARVEFLCGHRAVRRARTDWETLARVALLFSAPPDQVPELVAGQQARLREAEKARQRLARELAEARGRELYEKTVPDDSGLRKAVRQEPAGPVSDELRAEARSFTENPKAIFAAFLAEPPSVLLAASADAGFHAGNLLKDVLSEFGGRGGGNARIAQGSLPAADAIGKLRARLLARVSGGD